MEQPNEEAYMANLSGDPEKDFSPRNIGGGDGSYYQLQKMREIHHEIVRRLVMGQKVKTIAEQLGVSEPMVQYTKRSPVVKQHIRIMQGARDHSTTEVMEQIKEISPLALMKMEEILVSDDASDTDKRLVAKDILDRAGFNPVHKHDHRHAHLTSQDIEDIKKNAKDAASASGILAEEVTEAKPQDDESNKF